MADRAEYTVMVGGLPHTFLLSPEDAERAGVSPVRGKASAPPANKARAVSNKSATASSKK